MFELKYLIGDLSDSVVLGLFSTHSKAENMKWLFQERIREGSLNMGKCSKFVKHWYAAWEHWVKMDGQKALDDAAKDTHFTVTELGNEADPTFQEIVDKLNL